MKLVSLERISFEPEEAEAWKKFYEIVESVYERTNDYHLSDIAHRLMMDMDDFSTFFDEE